MGRPKKSIPKLCHHKASDQAFVYVDRKPVYLGPWDSAEAAERYAALISAGLSGTDQREAVKAPRRPPGTTIAELVLRFAVERLPQYTKEEQACLKSATGPLVDLFSDTPAAEFGPMRLRAVREKFIEAGWSRSYVNHQVKRLRRVLRWAVGWELIPSSVVDSLSAVEPLKRGDAPDHEPRKAVSDADLKKVRAAFLNDRHRDLFDLLLLTGARIGEVLGLTPAVIDRSGDVWRVDLQEHKTAHRGKARTLFFNQAAQAILARYIEAAGGPDKHLFKVRSDNVSKAFGRACKRAKVKAFSPHSLRHTTATRLADMMGTEAAQRLLGHADAAMTEHYSRSAERLAVAAAKSLAGVGTEEIVDAD